MTGLTTGRHKIAVCAGAAAALAGTCIGTVAATSSQAAASPSAATRLAGPAGPAAVGSKLPSWDPAAMTLADKHGAVARQAEAHRAAAPKTAALAGHKTAAHSRARVHVVKRSHRPLTWQQVRDLLARQTFPKAAPGKLPLADRLRPGSVSGPQAYLAMTASRMANATTIVHRALARHMGLRSAVIAVATAMQESTLDNISYGDRDSEGLFQQRPSAGWGSSAQITNPSYASDAFLKALRDHERADPSWASKPLWASAQAVQNSGFPQAYAKWESQAAQLVSTIARQMF